MLIYLEKCDINDPNAACIDSILPGVVSRLDKIDSCVNTLSQTFKKYAASPLSKGPFIYYVSKDVGGWGQKFSLIYSTICADVVWWSGLKKAENMLT